MQSQFKDLLFTQGSFPNHYITALLLRASTKKFSYPKIAGRSAGMAMIAMINGLPNGSVCSGDVEEPEGVVFKSVQYADEKYLGTREMGYMGPYWCPQDISNAAPDYRIAMQGPLSSSLKFYVRNRDHMVATYLLETKLISEGMSAGLVNRKEGPIYEQQKLKSMSGATEFISVGPNDSIFSLLDKLDPINRAKLNKFVPEDVTALKFFQMIRGLNLTFSDDKVGNKGIKDKLDKIIAQPMYKEKDRNFADTLWKSIVKKVYPKGPISQQPKKIRAVANFESEESATYDFL